ncbi:MAG TPA: hypothetical protein VJ954_06210, partial [Ignavibacteriaceae bacterium]|nr:hypothetical protein [Ignavibacteriaceae bacterium]
MTDKTSFLGFLKNISAPLIGITYIGTFFIQLKNYVNTLGWKFMFIIVLLLSISWCIYVFTTKRETIIEPKKKVLKYNSLIRYSSIVLIIACLIPVIYSFKPAPEFPKMPIRFENTTSKIATISKWGEFYLSVTDSPFSEFQIGSGRLVLEIEKDFLKIPPDSVINV